MNLESITNPILHAALWPGGQYSAYKTIKPNIQGGLLQSAYKKSSSPLSSSFPLTCHIIIIPETTTDLLLLSEDSSSAESLLVPLELPIDSWPWLSLPWLSLPWLSLLWDSVPLPLDPLLFISTSSSVRDRERPFLRCLCGEEGASCPLLSLPSDRRPRSGPPWL